MIRTIHMNADEYFAKWALVVKESHTELGTRYDVEDFTFYRYRKNRHPEQLVEWLRVARLHLRNEAESRYYAKRRRTKDPKTSQGVEISLEQHEKNRLRTAADYVSSYGIHTRHVCRWWPRICDGFRREIIGDPDVLIVNSFMPYPAVTFAGWRP